MKKVTDNKITDECIGGGSSNFEFDGLKRLNDDYEGF